MTWTREEWRAADDSGRINEWKPDVTEADLDPDEKLCSVCRGTFWEHSRDGDVGWCFWCGGTGKREHRPDPPKPEIVQRSPFHPPMTKEKP